MLYETVDSVVGPSFNIYARPVILGGLFPNGKYVGIWLPMLNR